MESTTAPLPFHSLVPMASYWRGVRGMARYWLPIWKKSSTAFKTPGSVGDWWLWGAMIISRPSGGALLRFLKLSAFGS